MLIYLKTDIVFKERKDIVVNDNLEMIWVEIIAQKPSQNQLLSCIYRPPNVSNEYYNDIVDSVEKAHAEDKFMSILGDLNINYFLDETLYENRFLSYKFF